MLFVRRWYTCHFLSYMNLLASHFELPMILFWQLNRQCSFLFFLFLQLRNIIIDPFRCKKPISDHKVQLDVDPQEATEQACGVNEGPNRFLLTGAPTFSGRRIWLFVQLNVNHWRRVVCQGNQGNSVALLMYSAVSHY